MTFAPRVGLRVLGGGRAACEARGGLTCSADTTGEYTDRSPVMLGVDVLAHVTRGLRLGGGVSVVPRSTVELRESGDTNLGFEVSPRGIVEGLFDVSSSAAIALRLELGLLVLLPGSEHDALFREVRSACRQLQVDTCRIDGGPFMGLTYGGGVGFITGTERLRFRVDLAVQLYALTTGEVELSSGNARAGLTIDASGYRGWLLGGVEF